MKLFRVPPISNRASIAFLLVRVVAGSALMHHGWVKVQNPFGWMGPEASTPGVFQALAALSEFGGGLAWILGFLTPLASAGVASTMIVAVGTHAVVKGDPFVGHGSSYELASIYLSLAILWILAGPGKLSFDNSVFGKS